MEQEPFGLNEIASLRPARAISSPRYDRDAGGPGQSGSGAFPRKDSTLGMERRRALFRHGCKRGLEGLSLSNGIALSIWTFSD